MTTTGFRRGVLLISVLWTILGTALPCLGQAGGGVDPLSTSVVAIDPHASSTLYAATNGGVFKSVNGGASWLNASAGLPAKAQVGGLLIDPIHPSTLYINLSTGDIFKSTDGGDNWTAANEGRPPVGGNFGMPMAMDPSDPAVLYTGQPSGGAFSTLTAYYKTSNGAANWQFIHSDSNKDISSLKVDPFSPTTLYAANGKVLKSTNGGLSWRRLADPPFSSRIFTDPLTPGVLYAQDNLFGFVYKSIDGAESWSTVYQGASLTTLAVDPTNSSRVFVGGVGTVVSSTDAGRTWTAATNFPAERMVRSLAVDPNSPSIVYAGTDAGVFKSIDGAATWQLSTLASETQPRLATLSISTAAQDEAVTLTITGNGFTSPFTLDAGNDVASRNVTLISSTTATATLSISPTATIGTREVRVTTSGGTSNALPFSVTARIPVVPTLSSVAPRAAARGSSTAVTLSGTGFTSTLTIDTGGAGREIAVSNVRVLNSTMATATFTTLRDSVPGPHEVTILTLGGISNPATFVVTAARQLDLTGDGNADLLLYNSVTGQTSAWLMNGSTITSQALMLTHPEWRVTETGDLNGDGRTDLIWYNAATGETVAWLMNGTNLLSWSPLLTHPVWRVTATGDFNGDGKSDLVWTNPSTGETVIWLMNGMTLLNWASENTAKNMSVTNVADFNGDGNSDLLWYNTETGETSVWLMTGTTAWLKRQLLVHPDWKVRFTADFNGDGKADLLWYNAASGETVSWIMDGVALVRWTSLLTDSNRQVTAIADFNADGKDDLLWYDSPSGRTFNWLMDGTTVLSQNALLTEPNWKATLTADFNGDSKADLLWQHALTNEVVVWLMNGSTPSSYASLSSGVQRAFFTDPPTIAP